MKKIGKRMMALCLALILGIGMGAESLCVQENVLMAQQYGEVEEETEEKRQGGEAGDGTEQGEASGEEPSEGGESEEPPGEPEPEPLVYTITYDLAGGYLSDGSKVAYQQVAEGAVLDIEEVAQPIRTGYVFLGWVDEAGNGFDFSKPILGDRTVTADWQPITYRVRFDANGGTGEMAEQIFAYDEKKPLSKNGFLRPNYVFTGWKLNGLLLGQDGEEVKNLASQDGAVITLTASWERGKYEIRYNANGGTGTMDRQIGSCGKDKTLRKNTFKRTGYTFVEWNTKKNGSGAAYKSGAKVNSLSSQSGAAITLYAIWKPVTYKVLYVDLVESMGGMGHDQYEEKHVYGTSFRLRKNTHKRKGYTFVGWSYWDQGTKKYKILKDQAVVKNLASGEGSYATLFAEWKAVKYSITYKLNGGKIAKSAKNVYAITTRTFTLPRPTRKGYDFDGWYKDKKYKKRIGEVVNGSTGNLTLYAKWVKCTRQAKSNSAKLTACKVVSQKTVKVQAAIKSRVASSDDYYYLMYVSPVNKKPYRMVKKAYKKKKVTFSLSISENRGYVVSMFGIAVKKGGKYKLISAPSYVKNQEKAAKNRKKYNPGKTKKGIQFDANMDEIAACGAKQIFLNITVGQVCNEAPTTYYTYNGVVYRFNAMTRYQEIVRECNKKGITVTFQILLDWQPGQEDLISTNARVQGAAPYYSWNIYSNKSREKMEAIFSYLGQVFGQKNCYASNWILGNEVNNPNGWNYKGRMTDFEYFRSYAHAFRALYVAIRSQYANAKIFICADNFWNTAVKGGFSTIRLLSSFTNHLKEVQKGLKWNLAYHAYSAPLTYTNFWHGYGISNNAHTPYVTMKNLNVLTNYVKKKYGSSVRIILSEQGYSSSWGQANQAAALAYSYYIAACNPMVDAFIIRSYRDAPEEVAQGLAMGIVGKEAFQVYKYMDTSSSFRYTRKYLHLIGAKSWNSIVPHFTKSRVKKMYRK